MTAQEAIDVLFNEWKCIDRNDGIHCDRKCETCDLVMDVGIIREAFNMAIFALQAQDSPKPTAGSAQNVQKEDLISRKAAIDAFCSHCYVSRPETCSTIQKGDKWCEEVYTILNLPSAQPELFKNSPKLDSGNGEWISKQAVFDSLEKVADLFPYKKLGDGDSYSKYNEAWNDAIGRAEMEIEKLPSAQPDTKAQLPGEGTTSDCISRQAAIDYCYALINAENPSDPSDEWNYSQERINQTEVILHHLEFMPSAQHEIIHCKDCKHYGVDRYKKLSWCSRINYGYGYHADDFCSKAERRTDDKTDKGSSC